MRRIDQIAKFTVLVLLFSVLIYFDNMSNSNGQIPAEDPEIMDIRVRVTNVTWEIVDTLNHNFRILVDLELWNPYNQTLVMHGSDPLCDWRISIELTFDLYVANIEYFCILPFVVLNYPPGLTSQLSGPFLIIDNFDSDVMPNGTMIINGGGSIEDNSPPLGRYSEANDLFFGANVTIKNGISIIEFEELHDQWNSTLLELTNPTMTRATESGASDSMTEGMSIHFSNFVAIAIIWIIVKKKAIHFQLL